MVRETSLEAYNKIKSEGLLSERRWQVYHVLFHYGPLTGNEVWEYMKKEFSSMAGSQANVHPRLGELRDMGVVVELSTKICSITGQKNILWEVTTNLPVKFEKDKSIKCPHCKGSGKLTISQGRLF